MSLAHRISPHALGVRLFLFVVVSVGVVLAVHSYASYRATRRDLRALVRLNAETCSDLIVRATRDGMLLNRLDEVQSTFEKLTSNQGVAAIRVFDMRGAIALSANAEEIGTLVSLESPLCTGCHAGTPGKARTPWVSSIISPADDRGELLQHMQGIPNEPSCAGSACHASPEVQSILGVIDVELSMAPVQATLRAEQSRVVWTTLMLMAILGLGSAGFIHQVIHRPVLRLQAGTRQIASGHLQTRIDVAGNHELAALALAFNDMAAELETARAELTDWSQRLEDKVVAKTQELQQAQSQVLQMERMSSLGRLSATVAHELNNPLSAMLNYARLVQRDLDEDEPGAEQRARVDRFLRLLQTECVRCGRIVSNLLLFARPQGASLQSTDLGEVIERSLMLVQHHLQVRGIRLELAPLPDNSTLIADSGELEQALVAILINAVEAMDEGGERDNVLAVRVDGDDEIVRLHITDSGVGIDPEAVPRLFEPFFSTKNAQSGVGLGLSVVYGIVRRHGGSIEVESEPGQGATFHISLPRSPKSVAEEISAGGRE